MRQRKGSEYSYDSKDSNYKFDLKFTDDSKIIRECAKQIKSFKELGDPSSHKI